MRFFVVIKHKYAAQLHWIADRRRILFNTFFLLIKSPKSYIWVNGSFRQRGWKVIPTNIGDDLNSFLLEKITGKRVFNYSESYHLFRRRNYMVIGSLIDWKTNSQSIVWGSGVMNANKELKQQPKRVLAVRGELTKNYLMDHGIDCPKVYGDPALLLPLVYNCPSTKVHKIGLVPHYVDLYSDTVKRLMRNDGVVLLNVQDYTSCESFIDLLRSCDIIISSSLHGLIIADAYDIPNVWVKFSDKVIGDDFKYYDYFTSVNRKSHPIFVNQDTELSSILAGLNNYEHINYNPDRLIASCPFIDYTALTSL